MSKKEDNLKNKLHLFDLNSDESLIFITLLQSSKLSALNLSKKTKIPRTKVYRILESLINKGFIVEKVEGYGKKFIAESPDKLSDIIDQKEEEIKNLKTIAPSIINELTNLQSQSDDEYKILHYKGTEGFKQVTWNSTKAERTLRIYELANNMDEFMPVDFNERVRKKLADKKITIRQLTNYKELNEHTDVSEVLDYWEPRYIDPTVFKINFEILIYNNVYTMYNFRSKNNFIAEIHNKELAEMQKQIFDSFWSIAKPMKKIDTKGKAVLI